MQLIRLLPAEATTGMSGIQLALFALPLLVVVAALVASRRRQREAMERQAAIQVGDHVITASGMLGRVVSSQGDVTRLEVAPGVVVEFDRRAVVGAVPATSPEATAGGAGATVAPKKEQ